MNLLQRALIEKAGHDNGFENVLPSSADGWLILGSARHATTVSVQAIAQGFDARLLSSPPSLPAELSRSFPSGSNATVSEATAYRAADVAALARWLRRAAALAQALPNQAMAGFVADVEAALASLEPAAAKNTEVQRMVRQRVGQQAFRQAMLDYWQGACAVTGLAVPQALRASHAKAWALCTHDAERLDVFNGFLLSANLDALFDSYLASFTDHGTLLIAPSVPPVAREQLGLTAGLQLRWVAPQHQPYLAFHRAQCQLLSW
ncbi:HNH endonuclease [Aquincola tertiaricarbonis]|uniref:HNH endonuclease n=1 Tax=Aquincola tertiaricarbonis TaxID=391953 RepID=UPI000614A24C|nr:HNH endonuclease [Aquincola tertiaricarbonis]